MVTMISGGSTDLSDRQFLYGSTFLDHQQDHSWWPSLQELAGPSIVSGATDINTDYHCVFKAKDQGMALDSN